jgi:hypothetical protein
MLVKAAQLGAYPRANEPLRSFFTRISEVVAKGVYWALDRHCYDAYDLGRAGVRKDAAHDAANDCRLTAELFETLRRLGEQSTA